MSNKFYAVLLVLAGMFCGILLVSLTSSPASAKLTDESRATEQPAPVIARPGAVKPAPARVTTPTRPGIARPSIRVYPIGMDRNGSHNHAHAYVVKDGKLYYCEDRKAQPVGLN
jgi:hypothetical protein